MLAPMKKNVTVIGGGLAGSEAALSLAARGIAVRLVEMRPATPTAVHHTDGLAELVCSNSLKSTKPDSAAGMLKTELARLGSPLFAAARRHQVAAGGALAVDRAAFSADVTAQVEAAALIELIREEAVDVAAEAARADAVVLATGPLTSEALSDSLAALTGADHLAFYDAAAPVVMADSLDYGRLFRQSRYEEGAGDYLNAPFDRDEYEAFIDALLGARRVIDKAKEAVCDEGLLGVGDIAVITCGDRFTSPVTRDAEGNVEKFAPTNVMYVVQIRGEDVTEAIGSGPGDALMTRSFFRKG